MILLNDAETDFSMNKRRDRGRPSENSRERIIHVALQILAREPEKKLTMARVAKELGLVTMALYKHVENKDDLLEGIANLVFSEYKVAPISDAPWQQQLENWAMQLRHFFHQNPYIPQIIGWELHMSEAWLSLTASLTQRITKNGRITLVLITLEHSVPMQCLNQAAF